MWITVDNIKDTSLTYSYERHKPIKLKNTPWLYCQYCGLLYLNNQATKWCIRMGCNYIYHKDFRRKLG